MSNFYKNINWTIKIGSKERQKKYLLFFIYIMSICLAYIWVLSPTYSYSLLTYRPNTIKLCLSVVLILITLAFIPSDEDKPSTFLFYIYFSITYIPTATYYWLNDQPTPFIVYETVCVLLIAFVVKWNAKPIQMSTNRAKVLIQLIFFIYIISCIYLVLHNGGIHLNSIISDIYSVRSENNISGLSGYLLNWCAKSFMPLFFVYFFIKRKWVGVFLTSVLQAILFFSYGFKAFIVAVIMLIGVSALMMHPEKFKERWMIILSFGNVICTIFAKLFSLVFINLYSYRTLILPAQGQFEYYDFFTHHDFLYFSEGSIGKLFGIQYPYSESIGRIVNYYIYSGTKISNGNTGALSYGFADLGFGGMLLAALAIGIVFVIVDSTTKNLPKLITVGAMAYQMFILNDNNILICINTGGIFWTIIMLIIISSLYSSITQNQRVSIFPQESVSD
ncbi:MAG: hypothetical protein IKE92_09670 [Clostridiales bacterium]|nr:hypothetical protein [Clostridiales bacterium]